MQTYHKDLPHAIYGEEMSQNVEVFSF